MIMLSVKRRDDGSYDVECGYTATGKALVEETAAAIVTIAARAESIKPGNGFLFRALLMDALLKDEVWDPALVSTSGDQGAVQS